MLRHRLLVIAVLASLVAACGKKEGGAPGAAAAASAASAASAPAAVLLVSAEDLRLVGQQAHANGPVITGSIQAERRADLRAEVSAMVLQVLKDNGEVVHKGDLLVRLDDTSIRDTLASAEESARASRQSLDQAERQYQRLKTLQGQGMSSMQALEDAEMRRNNAQSDLVAAEARMAAARQQRTRTEVRAPFDGLLSDRKISAGDTVQVGRELVKVIDPTSMRFEGLVTADRLREVSAGQTVLFRVNGIEAANDFVGKVRRVDASADSSTRQLSVLVDFTQGNAPRVAGLYAEGQIATGAAQALMLPEASIAREGDKAYAWKLKGGALAKTALQLGERDARRGQVVVLAGLAEGDEILRNPGATLVDGQKVERAKVAAPAASAASR